MNGGAINNIMPLYIMKERGLDFTDYYEIGESICTISSRRVSYYGENKYFYAYIRLEWNFTIIITIIVVDLRIVYGFISRGEWSFYLGGYMMNDGTCMILLGQDDCM